MLEQHRLDYLHAMGVVQWMPRAPLPFAPAPRYLAEQPPSETAVVLDVDALMSSARAAASPTPAKPATPPVQTVPRLLPEQVSDRSVPHFSLFFVRTALPVLWVISRPEPLASLQRFSFNVQQALLKQSHFLPDPVQFHWPFIHSAKEDQSVAVAKQALRAQWTFFQNQGMKAVVCLDDLSLHWLTQIEVPCVFHTTGLERCLNEASVKRELWLKLSDFLCQ